MSITRAVDVAIVVPLEEEFRQLYTYVGDSCRTVTDNQTGRSFYLFDRAGPSGEEPYHCVTSFVGEMGEVEAAALTSELIEQFSPRTLVLLGIAGSLTKDLTIGDVVAADQVEDYLTSARAESGGAQGYQFRLSGKVYRPHRKLNQILLHFRFSHRELYERIARDSDQDFQQLVGERSKSFYTDGLVRKQFTIDLGPIASGVVVGAAQAFADWLLHQRNRKFLAIEMEAAGVLYEIYRRAGDERAVILRGISDCSDERKARFDEIGGGSLRVHALRNAIRMLFGLFEIGAIERSSPNSGVILDIGTIKQPDSTIIEGEVRFTLTNRTIADIKLIGIDLEVLSSAPSPSSLVELPAGPIDETFLCARLAPGMRPAALLERHHVLKPGETDGFFLRIDAEEGHIYTIRLVVIWHLLGTVGPNNRVLSSNFTLDFPSKSPEALLRLADSQMQI